MAASLTERHNRLNIKPDPCKAAHACRLLIGAYLEGPDGVDCSDIDVALAAALAAFKLPETFVESEGGKWG